jgi:demethylmenaquinone methyltransferase / 2-methoxy-6-polyprenyl-1,4-benzoquinol methylase
MIVEKADTSLIFNRIACNYDFLNHLLSFGVDRYWRKIFVKNIPNRNYKTVVDLAAGTGDLLVLLKNLNATNYYAVDPAIKMLELAKKKFPDAIYVNSFAENIPLNNDSADIVTIAFGIRNFSNPDKALSEINRILKMNGILAIMEFDKPQKKSFSKAFSIYFDKIMPFIGEKISGDKAAYSYFSNSVNDFNSKYNLQKQLQYYGFEIIQKKSMFLGAVKMFYLKKVSDTNNSSQENILQNENV